MQSSDQPSENSTHPKKHQDIKEETSPNHVTMQEEQTTKTTIEEEENDTAAEELFSFQELLEENNEVKGWLTIPKSNIDYVVLQSAKEDPEYYLSRNLFKEYDRAGSLFLDCHSSIEDDTQNLVIHGHNMTSTDNMFHYLMNYKELSYYKERPVFTFDTIYEKGEWKIFAVIITNGSSEKEPLFDYTKATFENSSDFFNFVYQVRIRSLYQIDTVDIQEDDQLLMLSTCSYEVDNYRTVVIARKVRDGEDPIVDVNEVVESPHPLYPSSWYLRYGGEAPDFPFTFEEALEEGIIHWYHPL